MDKDEQKTLNEILIHVGETRKGISGLETDVRDFKDQVSVVSREGVKRPECTERHRVVAASISDLKQDLAEIKKDVRTIRIKTSEDHPAITRRMLEGQADERKGRDLRYWTGVGVSITVLMSFLGSLIWGIIAVGRYIERMDVLAASAKKQQAEFKTRLDTVDKMASRMRGPKEPAMMGPMQPDAGLRLRPARSPASSPRTVNH